MTSIFLVDRLNGPICPSPRLKSKPLRYVRYDCKGCLLKVLPTISGNPAPLRSLQLSRPYFAFSTSDYDSSGYPRVVPTIIPESKTESCRACLFISHHGGFSIWDYERDVRTPLPLKIPGMVAAMAICSLSNDNRKGQEIKQNVVVITKGGLLYLWLMNSEETGFNNCLSLRLPFANVMSGQFIRISQELVIIAIKGEDQITLFELRNGKIPTSLKALPLSPGSKATIFGYCESRNAIVKVEQSSTRLTFTAYSSSLQFEKEINSISIDQEASCSALSSESAVIGVIVVLGDWETGYDFGGNQIFYSQNSLSGAHDFILEQSCELKILNCSGFATDWATDPDWSDAWATASGLEKSSLDFLIAFDILQEYPSQDLSSDSFPFLGELLARALPDSPQAYPDSWQSLRNLWELLKNSTSDFKFITASYLLLTLQPDRYLNFALHHKIGARVGIEAMLYACLDKKDFATAESLSATFLSLPKLSTKIRQLMYCGDIPTLPALATLAGARDVLVKHRGHVLETFDRTLLLESIKSTNSEFYKLQKKCIVGTRFTPTELEHLVNRAENFNVEASNILLDIVSAHGQDFEATVLDHSPQDLDRIIPAMLFKRKEPIRRDSPVKVEVGGISRLVPIPALKSRKLRAESMGTPRNTSSWPKEPMGLDLGKHHPKQPSRLAQTVRLSTSSLLDTPVTPRSRDALSSPLSTKSEPLAASEHVGFDETIFADDAVAQPVVDTEHFGNDSTVSKRLIEKVQASTPPIRQSPRKNIKASPNTDGFHSELRRQSPRKVTTTPVESAPEIIIFESDRPAETVLSPSKSRGGLEKATMATPEKTSPHRSPRKSGHVKAAPREEIKLTGARQRVKINSPSEEMAASRQCRLGHKKSPKKPASNGHLESGSQIHSIALKSPGKIVIDEEQSGSFRDTLSLRSSPCLVRNKLKRNATSPRKRGLETGLSSPDEFPESLPTNVTVRNKKRRSRPHSDALEALPGTSNKALDSLSPRCSPRKPKVRSETPEALPVALEPERSSKALEPLSPRRSPRKVTGPSNALGSPPQKLRREYSPQTSYLKAKSVSAGLSHLPAQHLGLDPKKDCKKAKKSTLKSSTSKMVASKVRKMKLSKK